MAFSSSHFESTIRRGTVMPSFPIADLEDDRILIDIQTEMALQQMESTSKSQKMQIPQFLKEGRTLGPLSVLLILALYSLLSPLLSPAIHAYIYHILH